MKNIFLGIRKKDKILLIFIQETEKENTLTSYNDRIKAETLITMGDCFKLTDNLETSIFFYRDKDKIDNKDTFQYDNDDDYRKACMAIEYNNSFKNLKKMLSNYNFFIFEGDKWVRYGNKSG
jgi:hypothetical protein